MEYKTATIFLPNQVLIFSTDPNSFETLVKKIEVRFSGTELPKGSSSFLGNCILTIWGHDCLEEFVNIPFRIRTYRVENAEQESN